MNKILFSLFSVPLMFSSIFTIADLFPYGEMNLISNGEIVEVSDSEKAEIQEELLSFLENAYDSPALAVTFPELYTEMIKEGYYLNFKFDSHFEINGLAFDELTFKVEEDGYGFNIYRGVDGEFRGRCFYLNCENSSQNLYETIKNIVEKEITTDYN